MRATLLLGLLGLLGLPSLVACAGVELDAIDASTARRARWCAEEHPIDAGARLSCEDARGVTAAAGEPSEGSAAYVYVAPSENAGQGLTDYGRQLAARPVRCTSIGLGTYTRTSCR